MKPFNLLTGTLADFDSLYDATQPELTPQEIKEGINELKTSVILLMVWIWIQNL